MTKLNITLILSLFITLCNQGYSQESSINNIYAQNVETIDKDILFSLVILQDKDGNFSTGFLIGLKSDSLVLNYKNTTRNISIYDLISLSIETKGKGGMRGVTIGGILGTYLFFLAFWQTENEPFAYWQNEQPGGQAIVSLLGTLLGGAVGYAIEKTTAEDTEIFNFSGNDKERRKEIQRLKDFLTGKESVSKIHLSLQLSQVSTRLSESGTNINDPYHQYEYVTSFNLLRKAQLTYSILDELEIGGAVSWFGEPSVRWYPNSSGPSEISSGEHTYKGYGFYAMAVYNPFHSFFSQSFALKIGAGIGIGNVDYEFTASKEILYPYYTFVDTTIASIDESLFSSILYTQFDLFLYDRFSIGFVADYIYLPEEIPGIPELDISSRKLGNFSFGLTLGLHF